MTQPSAAQHLEHLASLLRKRSYSVCSEDELQRAVAQVLFEADVVAHREQRLASGSRPDFIVEANGCRLAVELKIKGSASAVIRQLFGYAEHESVDGVLLVTTLLSCALRAAAQPTMAGKPVRVVHLAGGAL